MEECNHLKGRPYELCTGVGRDGRPNPTQRDSDTYRRKMGLEPIVVQEPTLITSSTPGNKSKIGTNLAALFAEHVGAVPCGECKRAIAFLNSLPLEEVVRSRDTIVAEIYSRALKSAPTWLTKLAVYADKMFTGGTVTTLAIGMWLDEACVMEQQNASQRPI